MRGCLSRRLLSSGVYPDSHRAGIALCADKPTNGLGQFEAGLRYRDFPESITPVFLQPLRQGLAHRVGRNAKRQLGNDDVVAVHAADPPLH